MFYIYFYSIEDFEKYLGVAYSNNGVDNVEYNYGSGEMEIIIFDEKKILSKKDIENSIIDCEIDLDRVLIFED